MRAFDFKFDKAGYTRALRDVVEQEFKAAIRAFLAAAEARIPVRTGQAKGTLQPLAEFADYKLNISPVEERAGRGPDTALGKLNVTFDWPSFSISFKVDLDYFEVLDTQATYVHSTTGKEVSAKGIPWLAMEHGREAFKDHLKKNLKRNIPKVTKFLTRTSLELTRDE